VHEHGDDEPGRRAADYRRGGPAGRPGAAAAADFEALLRTTPDKAAEIICRGVERGKARILVGPDAYLFDALARITPTHYYDVMAVLEKRLRAAR
jgi:hypothetical protein